MKLRFRILAGEFSVCRLPSDAPLPPVSHGSFYSLTRTPDEISIVCEAGSEPPESRIEAPWRVIALEGPIPFETTGVAAELTRSLARREISVFVLSTFDTDYVLVGADRIMEARAALVEDGHSDLT